uniref:Hedgehog/Intein (Hint) domain-containing protein n=1 Tax=viral metagenome TaxID=1070528 RepID=A0A6C0LNZ9_9ZZZZ
MVNIPSKPLACMYKMVKTVSNGLTKDLIVTGGHSILVDDLGELKEINDQMFGGNTPKIDGKYLLLSSVSPDFSKLENHYIYTWYHFTLENDGDDDRRFGVWANGILTETPSKNQLIQMGQV